MKRLFRTTTLAAMAATVLMLTACTDNEVFSDDPDQGNTETAANAISFGTYMGRSTLTRAGYEGTITDDILKKNNTEGANGFGVFAYYTGTATYNAAQYVETDAAKRLMPNFMYNQQVKWETSAAVAGYVNGNGETGDNAGAWTYSPVKYWPNEIGTTNGPVDDQDDNQGKNPASTPRNYGGNVSFFAYAPYVVLDPATGKPKSESINYNGGEADGIIAVTKNSDTGDPKVTYVIASDGNVVDLLWGTYGETKESAISEDDNKGVTGSKETGATDYQKAIFGKYTTNADLNKQKTTGTVGFAFKHALAKIGGKSQTDPESGEARNGFMVVLDIDDMKGAETGGSFDNMQTKVTINSVTISNNLDGDTEGKTDGKNVNGTGIDEMGINKGTFNLATGQWEIETSSAGVMNHTIYPENNSTTGSAKLNKAIAELLGTDGKEVLKDANSKDTENNSNSNYINFFAQTNKSETEDFSGQTGVLPTKKLSVYEDEANPIVFIPGTAPALRITVDYYVRTKDENLYKGYSEVRQVITKLVKFPEVELNKQYSLLMHIGLTSVKFTATVSDWEVVYNDKNGNGQPEGDEITIQDVYLPINVSELKSYTISGQSGSIESNGGAYNIDKVKLTYSDSKDDIEIEKANYTSKGVTFSSSNTDVATVEATTGVVTFTENKTPNARPVTITLTRGNQTAGVTLTQSAGTLQSIALTLAAPTTISTEGGTVTPTVTATFQHTGTGSSTYTSDVTKVSSYTVGSTAQALSEEGKLTIASGTAEETVAVKAEYTQKKEDIKNGSADITKDATVTLTYKAPSTP